MRKRRTNLLPFSEISQDSEYRSDFLGIADPRERLRAIFRWRHPGQLPERPVERGKGGVAQIKGNSHDLLARVLRVAEDALGLRHAMVVQKGGEVSVAEPLVDQPAQTVLRELEALAKRSKRKVR